MGRDCQRQDNQVPQEILAWFPSLEYHRLMESIKNKTKQNKNDGLVNADSCICTMGTQV